MIKLVASTTKLFAFARRFATPTMNSVQDIFNIGIQIVDTSGKQTTESRQTALTLLSTFSDKFAPTYAPHNEDELLLFIDLACKYQINERKIWNILSQTINKAETLSIPTKITMLQSLRHASRHNEDLFNYLAHSLLVQTSKLDINELVQLTLAYCYYPHKDPDTTKKLEKSLVANIGKIDPCDFCVLLDELAYNDLKLLDFLEIGQDYVFKKCNDLPKEGFGGIVAAYAKFLPKESKKTLRMLASEIIMRINEFSLKAVVDLASLYSSDNLRPKELFDEFRKVIVNRFPEVQDEDIALILSSFTAPKVYSHSLFIMFHKKVKECAARLSIADMVTIVESYSKVNTEDSCVYELLESHITKRIKEVQKGEAMRLIAAYANQNLKAKFKVFDHLEGVIRKYKQEFSIGELVSIAYFYVIAEKGRNGLVNELLSDITKNIEKINKEEAIWLMAITVRHKLRQEDCELVATQLYRYFDELSAEQLKEVLFLADRHKEYYSGIKELIENKLSIKQT